MCADVCVLMARESSAVGDARWVVFAWNDGRGGERRGGARRHITTQLVTHDDSFVCTATPSAESHFSLLSVDVTVVEMSSSS